MTQPSTRSRIETAWGTYEYDSDLYDTILANNTVRALRDEIRERMDGDWQHMNHAAFWRMPKAHLAAIVSEWATFERQNAREVQLEDPFVGSNIPLPDAYLEA